MQTVVYPARAVLLGIALYALLRPDIADSFLPAMKQHAGEPYKVPRLLASTEAEH